jgi:hypothetical protein
MSDVIGQGGGEPPRSWPRRVAVIAALLLVAGAVVWRLPWGGHAPAAHARPAVPATPAAAGPGGGLAAEADGVTGRTLPWERGARLPVAGRQPAWFWPATGRTQSIGGLPPDGSGYGFTAVAGGWAIQPSPATGPGCAGCAGPPQPVYFLGGHARSVSKVGLADAVAPGAAPGTLWLTTYPAHADTGTAAGTAREVSVTGAPLAPRLTLPRGYVIDRATDRGLLLAPAVQRAGGAADLLWATSGSRPDRTFRDVIAASAGAIAWAPACDRVCQVRVLDLATGGRTTVDLPGASSAANGAFSPDGDFLALEVSFYNSGDDGALAMQLEVASASSGRLTVVPGTWVSSDALVGFGWPDGGDSLVAELSFTTKVQVTYWRPGAARLAVAAIRPAVSDVLITG